MRPRSGGFSGLALALVAFGVLLLLRQTGVIAQDIRIWPIVVLAIGVGLLVAVLTYIGGLHQRVDRDGDVLVATSESEFGGGHRGWRPGERDWDLQLKPGFALDLEFETGAGRSFIDLSGLLVNSVALRFPRSGEVWESPGWEAAADRADGVLEGGAGSFSVR
jgi:hypothetical protein